MELAFHVAGWSKDPSTKVGAVLVGKDIREIALGYNGFPTKIVDLPSRLVDRETKYILTIHAERNVLDNAKFDTNGATLYCTQIPCTKFGCSLSLISKGISRVVFPLVPEREPWLTDSIHTKNLLIEAGIIFLELPSWPY